jgi:UDP-3-O-acyl-N-acetylglucosamine deacetylase
MFCVFQEPSGGGYEEVIKELVRDSFGGDAFSVEEAVVLLRKNVAERDALKAENENLRRQLMDLVVDKAYMTRNDLLLRQELDDIRSGSEPNVLQLKQLLTEPAVNREFQRLSSLAKSASLEAAALREEIRAMHVRYLT